MADCSFGVILLRLSEEMYIQKAEITNIKSIEHFEIEFPNPAGWHVLIGDNGSGKSTIVRSMALALVGREADGLRENWKEWIRKDAIHSPITVNLIRDKRFDIVEINGYQKSAINHIDETKVNVDILITKERKKFYLDGREINTTEPLSEVYFYENQSSPDKTEEKSHWLVHKIDGFFSVAFGPYRRFEGGSSEWDEVYNNSSLTDLAAHLSIFDESVALTEPIKWLKDLNYKTLEKNKESEYTLENLKKLINSEDFLPHNSKLEKISSDGVFFKDGNGTEILVNQMSDGYRSILSLTFELIRQLVRVYGSELVFKNIEKGEMFIDLPGVVLIDEIDAHLHPSWQTRIGQWFLKYFPNLQFIVTTHSPLVCRAAEKGSIWRLAAPGSNEKSGEVTGIDRERLIYGNILDAYGTEVFGTNVTISEDSVKKQETLAKLSKKKMLDDISPEEEKKLEDLKKVFTTDAAIEL
jgi:predicted ATP-binding protein involved in virulence